MNKENTFNENDIRPDKYSEILKQATNTDINFLYSRKNNFIEIPCPACGKTNTKIEFTKNGFNYIECAHCGMLYISPRPSIQILNEFYPQAESYKVFDKYIFPSSQEVRREKIFKPRVKKVLDFCEKYSITKDKIIEIGTGYGTFCEEMVKTKNFKEVVGVETSDSLAKTCSKLGFRLYNGLLEDLNIDEKFDVAVAFEVLEHIFNPEKFLQKIYSILNKNSFLLITFPAWSGFDNSILREHARAIDHEHLNYFTEESITILLSRIGFEVLEITTPGEMDVDIVRKEIIANNVTVPKFIKTICVDKFETQGKAFQEFLKQNKLSSHMMVASIKK